MKMHVTRSHAAACLTAVALLALAGPALGAAVGPRVGLSIDPDQVHAGLGIQAARLSPHVTFMPSFDLGAGDNLIGFAMNMDFKYMFPGRGWSPYMGAGPGIFYWNNRHTDDSNTDVGVNFFGGLQTRTSGGPFYGELRLGLMDANPDLKFTVGWLFY